MRDAADKKERNFVATVIFVVKQDQVLLALKKEKIGAGRYNGPGGEVEESDPTIEFRAILEMREEIGLGCHADSLSKVAIGYFNNIKEDGSIFVCEVHFFLVDWDECNGKLKQTSEMGLARWFRKDNLPFDEMMAADNFFVPAIIFEKKKLVIKATLKNKQHEIVGEPEIEYVKSF